MSNMNLSYSTLRLLHECPHNFINKIEGIPQPDNEHMKAGREGHEIIQNHVSGKQLRDDLKHITFKFPIIEQYFERELDGHLIRGYIDGVNHEGQMLEIKLSGTPWSMKRFEDSPQRKIYGWAMPGISEGILITGSKDPNMWQYEPPKIIGVPFVVQHIEEAIKWMREGIDIIKKGAFLTDLDDGVCTDPRCYWGRNCLYKQSR